MRVLVCGGRDFTDVFLLADKLAKLHGERPISTIIHGGARGADSLAETWAAYNDIDVEMYPADWKKHGRSAGPLRNAQMLLEGKPDLVVAFPGGRGTADMVSRAKAAGVKVVEVNA